MNLNNKSKNPYISVIVIAYNRKQFLIDAVHSVINQTLDRSKYEIIIVKNFRDDDIDAQLNRFVDLNIYTDEISIGAKFARGIEISKGEILCFLEDDDIFKKNKLEVVLNVFKNKDLVYFHNNFDIIDEKGNLISKNNKSNSSMNMSAISIKKTIIDTKILKNARSFVDDLMYLFAINSRKKILVSNLKLSYYRMHNMNASRLSRDNIPETEIVIKQLNEFEDLFPNCKHCKKYIKKAKFRMILISNTLHKQKFPGILIIILILTIKLEYRLLKILLKYFINDYIKIV
ncbi:glycosyltransferase family A protein [Picrophilus oshimae]|uniref:Glycosyltransferase n=1 Tax=Picrophilus torridus (strain ATCC 700027 / DSM 9790 / JCM 10055 / NBRC 100828 / KAW 2/3) TaxID=1122961 RepID=Q6L2B5_PICTO|nr:glycosyltransferase family 2 protein [Picrophilus oshimae]AAT42887.1 glycosyltransferase [Picrophilus oshimae DSM 9789]